MLSKITRKIFGSRNERIVKNFRHRVACINQLETALQALDDAELSRKTEEFKQRLTAGETLEQILDEAFAVCREASVRTLGMRHYDVQLIGAMILNNNQIAEMRTGEGKTLVATLAAYLNALSGQGVHIVTVNDYLAERDSAWMRQLYEFLGLSVGVVLSSMDYDQKRQAYQADITYGTNNQFGFDYMHDNLSFTLGERVQRGLNFAIVDEVDSILIDEARTPLIISGQASDSSDLYTRINQIIPKLSQVAGEQSSGDFNIDEKSKQVFLTEQGHDTAEALLIENGLLTEGESLYDPANITLVHHLNAALRAHAIYHINVDYIVRGGQVVIVDEFTGRTMSGRRWSEGLHQAIEAKEAVNIQHENQTIASITFQNYFRLYNKLSGMTGTADTEAFEFQQIYGLEVVVIPTNQPMIREDFGDLIYLTVNEKFNAIIEDIQSCVKRGQPVLVGTTSVETSELLSSALSKKKIKHQILNAKQHEREAKVIADAGIPGSVTIATNMAGRGTDIVLGGNLEVYLQEVEQAHSEQRAALKQQWQERHDQVVAAGGLHIIGTERHESRRIDNQLRGRAGRQGDPGSTRFYLSMEDSLMRIFASERVASFMQKLGMGEGESIEHPWVSRAIENAQRKVEAHNFDTRKQLLQYDDVADEQRKVIYRQRDDLLRAENIADAIRDMRLDVVEGLFRTYVPSGSEEQWRLGELEQALAEEFDMHSPLQKWCDEENGQVTAETMLSRVIEDFESSYESKTQLLERTLINRYEKELMLMVLDRHWKEHLAAMDYLRQGIGLRGYAQKNPVQEYKRESFEMFRDMLDAIKYEAIKVLTRVKINPATEVDTLEQKAVEPSPLKMEQAKVEGPFSVKNVPHDGPPQPFMRQRKKVGRNEPCWCGSEKKYKQCHGKIS